MTPHTYYLSTQSPITFLNTRNSERQKSTVNKRWVFIEIRKKFEPKTCVEFDR